MFLPHLDVFGKLLKSHGYKGEMIASVVGTIPSHFELPEALFIVVNGIPVPFFAAYYEVISENSLLIKFDTILSREEAMKYYNCELMADKKIVSKFFPEQRPTSILGYSVAGEDGMILGTITAFDDIPGNPIITVVKDNNELILPVNEELILKKDIKARQLILRVPKGLIGG